MKKKFTQVQTKKDSKFRFGASCKEIEGMSEISSDISAHHWNGNILKYKVHNSAMKPSPPKSIFSPQLNKDSLNSTQHGEK